MIPDKPFYQSKTFWFNMLFIVIAIASLLGFTEYQPGDAVSETAAVLIAIVNLIMRFSTKTAIR